MNHFTRARLLFCTMLCAGFIVAANRNAAYATENCERLVALSYAGVELAAAQKQFKRKLVAWYTENHVRQARR